MCCADLVLVYNPDMTRLNTEERLWVSFSPSVLQINIELCAAL